MIDGYLQIEGGFKVLYPKSGLGMMKHARTEGLGGYQRKEFDEVVKYLISMGRPLDMFIDIGANVGQHSLYATQVFRQIMSFEPGKENFEFLQMNKKINPTKAGVTWTLHECAIGDKLGVTDLYLNPGNCGDNRLTPEDGFSCESVNVTTLDRVLVRPENVSLIWMDVQGSEGKVLGPVKDWLSCPVHMEFWPDVLGRDLDIVAEFCYRRKKTLRLVDGAWVEVKSVVELAKELGKRFCDILVV